MDPHPPSIAPRQHGQDLPMKIGRVTALHSLAVDAFRMASLRYALSLADHVETSNILILLTFVHTEFDRISKLNIANISI